MSEGIEVLDAKDRKILGLLDFNARMPLSELAREVGLSKQSVDYRLNALQRKGVISGFFPVINTPLLGYKYCRIAVQFGNLPSDARKKLLEYVHTDSPLFWAFELGGEYDYLFVYWVHSLTEFESICRAFEAQFGNYIRKKSEQLVTDVIHLSHKRFEVKPFHRFDLKETDARVEIDSLDRKILGELTKNARAPLTTIASSIQSYPKMVSERVKRMEKNGLLAGYRPIIHYDKIGLTYYKVFFHLTFDDAKVISQLEEYLVNHPDVLFIVHGIGMDGNLDIELLAESNNAFFAFITQLREKFPHLIGDYKYLILTQFLKVKYLPFV